MIIDLFDIAGYLFGLFMFLAGMIMLAYFVYSLTVRKFDRLLGAFFLMGGIFCISTALIFLL